MLVPSDTKTVDPREESICIIGAGAAGLITAHTLIQDGFTDVQILTRDKTVGGVWMDGRGYPGLQLNSLHAEYSFSCLPTMEDSPGARPTGDDMRRYMETFAEKFLNGKIRFDAEVVQIKREPSGTEWQVDVRDLKTDTRGMHRYTRIVLCTGGCSSPRIPDSLSPSAAKAARFSGPVLHTQDFNSRIQDVFSSVKPRGAASSEGAESVVIVGGGKSAQDISAYIANQDRKVSVVFETTDPILANPKPLPDYIRKSRVFSIFSPHSDLRTGLERFLHTTWVGSKIVNAFWDYFTKKSFETLDVPSDSPLRRTRSSFWAITDDEGVPDPTRFHALVNAGKIELVAPARVRSYGNDGRSVVLEDGRVLQADAVILATGYSSSWMSIFDDRTRDELGLNRQSPPPGSSRYHWNYKTLANPPPAHSDAEQQGASIVRGLVPAKNILRRDFAINGAVITNNNGMACEVSAHWISSYFLGDKMRVPATVDKALEHAERNAAWMRKRYPDMLLYLNESYSTSAAIWTWPQWIDDLLEDMELPSGRSGGNWLTWPFRVVRMEEIATLKEERDIKRSMEQERASVVTA